MKKLILIPLSFCVSAFSFAAAGDDFVGDWQRIQYPQEKAKITKNGDDFIVARNAAYTKETLKIFRPMAAKYKEGELHIGPLQRATIIKASGHLLIGNWEYVREQN